MVHPLHRLHPLHPLHPLHLLHPLYPQAHSQNLSNTLSKHMDHKQSMRDRIFECLKEYDHNHNDSKDTRDSRDSRDSKYLPIKVLDLFSGIGGFSRALKGITETIAFCEIDWACQQVLQRHYNAIPVDRKCERSRLVKEVLKDSNPRFLTFEGELVSGQKKNNMKTLDRSSPPKQPNRSNPHSTINQPLLIKDIHDINDTMMSKYPALKRVEMITAGFPCTDISVANYKGDGIDGNASGLFFEILRLVDLIPAIKFVFLENSPNIKLKGLDSVVHHFKERGFSCYWTYVCASDVGAYHRRKRWFCLCVRGRGRGRRGNGGAIECGNGSGTVVKKDMQQNGGSLSPHTHPSFSLLETLRRLRPAPNDNILKYKWREDKNRPRILHKDKLTVNQKREHIHRCRMLGNSIVPQAAAYAWNTLLCHIFSHHFSDRSKYLSNQLISGYLETRADYVPSPPPLIDNYVDIQCSDGNKSFTKTRWVTPNYSFWHMFSYIGSPRCETTLTVQIYYDKDTVIDEKNKSKSEVFNRYVCNAPFIEHLMGYPNNWTKFLFLGGE